MTISLLCAAREILMFDIVFKVLYATSRGIDKFAMERRDLLCMPNAA
ncbi:hypothetical protein APHNP_0191 [Anaplasma phagocytophilum str. ApNP]|uniref:Uncharacterized protein n=1 Tax=Anaplasma phagocytophilum str. ApNP TaxID=1359153 RepID=A0A0F3NHL5_ANAPH|nr:hypothetical protein APHNP_0191 [Anaplasma phagocytophilum str. ApNP]